MTQQTLSLEKYWKLFPATLKEISHDSDTFVFFFCFVFASGMLLTLERAEYSLAASYNVLGKNNLFPAGFELTTFRA